MSKNCSCHYKDTKKKSNLTSSVEEGCNKKSVENPKSAVNNQW